MGEIQGLYASGHNQDVDTFSKSSPFPAREGVATFFAAQSQYIGSSTIYHNWCLYHTPPPPSPNLVSHFSPVRTHINSCISLDVLHIGLRKAQVFGWPLSRADNAGGDCVLQRKGAAQSNNKLPLADVR